MSNNESNKLSLMQVAKLNEVTNVETIESRLSDYDGTEKGLPVTVSFHQEFQKKETLTVFMEVDELKMEDAIDEKTGEAVKVPSLEPVEKTLHNGKKITVWQAIPTGKKLKKKTRVETGDFLNDKRNYKARFIVKNAEDFRYEFGSALTEFYGALASGEVNFAKGQKVNMTFNFNGKVLSTKYKSFGGVKLSKVYKKGILQKDLYSSEFCKPLFQQIKDVANGEEMGAIEIDTAILNICGLTEKK